MGKRKSLILDSSPHSDEPALQSESTDANAFIQCLYSMVNTPNGPVKWSNANDNSIEVDILALATMLHDKKKPMQVVDIWEFMHELKLHGFEKQPSASSRIICYKHDKFIRDQPNLLPEITAYVESTDDEVALEDIRKSLDLHRKHRCDTDVCRMSMKKTYRKSELNSVTSNLVSKMFLLNCELLKDRVVIPTNLYANPEQSASGLMRNDFAGYYGSVPDDAIKEFFGSYLPVYAAENEPDAVKPLNQKSNDVGTVSQIIEQKDIAMAKEEVDYISKRYKASLWGSPLNNTNNTADNCQQNGMGESTVDFNEDFLNMIALRYEVQGASNTENIAVLNVSSEVETPAVNGGNTDVFTSIELSVPLPNMPLLD